MPIDKIAPYTASQPQPVRPQAERAEQSQTGGAGQFSEAAAAAPHHDMVNLTDTAARLQQLEQEISALPVVDEQRVAEIRQALAEGRFEIDPERVAQKLLDFETKLSG